MKSVDPGILEKSDCFSFTPSDLAKNLFFYPTWLGHYYCTENYFIKRESYSANLLVYVCEGTFHFNYRGNFFDAQKGDVVLLDCTEPHYYHACNGLEFLYIHFDGSNSHELCQYILSQNDALIRQANNRMIGHKISDMITFYKGNGIQDMVQDSANIYEMLEYLMTSGMKMQDREDPINKTIRYIRSHINENISLEELADVANMSSSYFSHYFKKKTGFSPGKYVLNIRLDQIKIMLAKTTKSISEIAYEVGYSSASALNNMFVKQTGMSPREYRRKELGFTK